MRQLSFPFATSYTESPLLLGLQEARLQAVTAVGRELIQEKYHAAGDISDRLDTSSLSTGHFSCRC